MRNEAAYFLNFLYTSSIVGLTAIGLIFCRRMLARGISIKLVGVFFMSIMLVDLAAFSFIAIPYFTLPREDLEFNENVSDVIIPEYRTERLYIKDQFRYFKPALYETFTAFDSSLIAHFDKDYINANLENMADAVMDGIFPLQDLVVTHTLQELIGTAEVMFEDWDTPQKFSFLNIIEIVLEDFGLKSDFFFSFQGIRDMVVISRVGMGEGYTSLNEGRAWAEKRGVLGSLNNLLRIRSSIREHIEDTGMTFYSQTGDISGIRDLESMHRYLFYAPSLEGTVADYLMQIRRMYRIDDPTFVRFRGYDRMVKMYEPTGFYSTLPDVREKMKDACAITGSIFRLYDYDEAEFIEEDNFWDDLKMGMLRSDVLYINTPEGSPGGNGSVKYSRRDGAGSDAISLKRYSPNRVEVDVDSVHGGYLYFSDGYDKYWQVSVNGEPEPLFKANVLFKAVKVGPGTSRVVFKYDPFYFRASLWLYYILSVICVIYLLKNAGRNKVHQQ